MMIFVKIWNKIFPFFKNKYILTFTVFAVWISFFDQNNLIDRVSDVRKLHQLEKQKEYFAKKIEDDTRRMKELLSDKDDLEKFAREQYLMKKKDEEVYVVMEE
jgi:cell division protein DivIC